MKNAIYSNKFGIKYQNRRHWVTDIQNKHTRNLRGNQINLHFPDEYSNEYFLHCFKGTHFINQNNTSVGSKTNRSHSFKTQKYSHNVLALFIHLSLFIFAYPN